MYCDCPYPGLCKHNLGVLTMLRSLIRESDIVGEPEFTAIESHFFGKILAISKQSITV